MPKLTPDQPVCARFSSLAILLRHVVEASRLAGMDDEKQKFVELVIEELFANTIHHAYGGESDLPVWLQTEVTENGLGIVYQDVGQAFSPFSPDYALTTDVPEDHRIGGLGIALINRLPDQHNYQRLGERNVMTLHFHR